MSFPGIARRLVPHRLRRRIRQWLNASPGVTEALTHVSHEFRLARAVRQSKSALTSVQGRTGLKVQLGCGPHIKPGWINIDLTLDPPRVNENSGTLFINHDLRTGLPVDNESCDLIYSAHFFEHLQYKDGLKLLRECYRALRPGGLFRISLPNFRGMFDAYLRGDRQYFDLLDMQQLMPEVEPGTETLVDVVNYGVYQYGEHQCVYDEEKVLVLLKATGFKSVAVSSFNPDLDPEEPLRQRYSFYIEAIK